jgi:O-antigen/teichoic acid export membrane protein
MSNGKFVRGTTVTFTTGVLNLILGVGTSVILARILGPDGRGIYALAMLLSSIIVTLGNLGIGSATVYYVARGEFRHQEILGSNILLSTAVGAFGIITGFIVVVFFHERIFPGVDPKYLLLALCLVPAEVFFSFVMYILLGTQHIKEFNYVQIVRSLILLAFIIVALLWLKAGVAGAILAGFLTWIVTDVLVFHQVRKIVGGVVLKPNTLYMSRAATYGLQAHLSNILGFFNYRVDILLINGFLGSAAVGLYSVGVGLVEKLWLVSQASSTVLFPRVAAETDEKRQKEFTPLIARTVLWITIICALTLALLSRWVVLLLYSNAFLPAVSALQALLIGIITLGVGRVLANDIAGRGRPIINVYISTAAVATNVILNILWIPKYGIVGAAWASTTSYTVSFFCALFFYCRISGNVWIKVILPQREDWVLYWKISKELCRLAFTKVKGCFE